MLLRILVRVLVIAGALLIAINLVPYIRRPMIVSTVNPATCPTINQIQSLSSLMTNRVEVADVVQTELHGFTGSTRVALVVRGDFLLGVDLSQARFEALNQTEKTAVLVLPAPQSHSPRVDHARSRVFAVYREGLWQFIPGERVDAAVLDRAFRDAQRLIVDAAGDRALTEKSRAQAQQVVGTFFHGLDWDVQIRWADH